MTGCSEQRQIKRLPSSDTPRPVSAAPSSTHSCKTAKTRVSTRRNTSSMSCKSYRHAVQIRRPHVHCSQKTGSKIKLLHEGLRRTLTLSAVACSAKEGRRPGRSASGRRTGRTTPRPPKARVTIWDRLKQENCLTLTLERLYRANS